MSNFEKNLARLKEHPKRKVTVHYCPDRSTVIRVDGDPYHREEYPPRWSLQMIRSRVNHLAKGQAAVDRYTNYFLEGQPNDYTTWLRNLAESRPWIWPVPGGRT